MGSMGQIIERIWYIVAVLPFLIFIEGSKMFAGFLKKKHIYYYWDIWHSYLVLLLIILVVLITKGYKW